MELDHNCTQFAGLQSDVMECMYVIRKAFEISKLYLFVCIQ